MKREKNQETMKDKRKSFRYSHQKTARYSSPDKRGTWQECSILNFSRHGISVIVREKITSDTSIFLEIPVPGEDDLVCLKGNVQWIKKRKRDYCGGIALNSVLDDEAFRKCLTGYHLDQSLQSREVSSDGDAQEKRLVASCDTKEVPILFPGKHLVSLKGVSVAFVFLVLLVAFPLLFLNVRGSASSSLHKGNNQKNVVADRAKEAHGEAALSRNGAHHRGVFKEEGGSLYALALKHYQKANETIFDLILHANPAIRDVRKIRDEQKITLPVITAASYVNKVADGEYRVFIGTFETFESAATYSKKISTTKKLLAIEPHDFSSRDTWYRLTMGDYPNREEALAAAVALTEKAILYVPPAQR